MFITFEGLRLIPSKSAMGEMFDLKLDLEDVLEVLVDGYDCAKGKRKKDILERCVDRGNKTTKVVVARSFNYFYQSDVWVITHVGTFTRKKGRERKR